MSLFELQQYDATGLAGLIASGAISQTEAVSQAIRAIESLNPALNAVIATDFERAMQQAKSGKACGPLAGVPYLVKDLNMSVADLPATHGSRAFQHFVPQADSVLVKRLRAAGLIILGKTNTPEFGLNICTSPALFGATKNPHDTDYSAGGSSGGSAAAVAAGMVPCAHATDSGGSIRIPASNCGLFGLKPSRSRVPLGNDMQEGLSGFSVGHAVTHSVRDSALLLDLTCGAMPGDFSAAPTQQTSFLQAMEAPLKPLKIACYTEGFAGENIHPDCQAAVQQSALYCEQLGHHVSFASPALDGVALREAFDVLFSANIARLMEVVSDMHPRQKTEELVEPVTLACAEWGKQFDAARYVQALQTTQAAARTLGEFFNRYDILLTPTLANPPLLVGALSMQSNDWPLYLKQMLDEIPFTPLFNATGAPAASLPLARGSNGLPIGVQIGGRYGAEALLLQLSRQLEQHVPWHNKQ